VLTRPFFVVNPTPQTVVQGGTVTFSAVAGPQHPLLPLWYRLVRSGQAFGPTNQSGIFTITNVQPFPNANGFLNQIRIQATNLASGLSGVASLTVNLTILADADGDGMPDAWETQYGFSTTNAADGALDFDGDGMSNHDEYVAGTDPTNPLSVLKLFATAANPALFQFVGQSNIAYTVQYRTNLTAANWISLTNIAAQPNVRTVDVDSASAPVPADQRYFRIATPPLP
jgi:hypothetical protein